MATLLDDIIKFLETDFADIRKTAKWDFSGKQVYTGNREINKICIALDPTLDAITSAINMGCELIVTHHPLFFHESKGLAIDNSVHLRAIKAIKNNLDILSYHTNIDISQNGINSYLAKILGATAQPGFLSYEGTLYNADYGFGKICKLPQKYSLDEFVALTKNKLETNSINVNMLEVEPFDTFAISSGSSASSWKDCLNKGVKVLLTGDMKYHDAQDAAEAGICIVDATHQATESIYMKEFAKILSEKFHIEVKYYENKSYVIRWE